MPPAHKKVGVQSLGRSHGGCSTKIHVATDALGDALRVISTSGARNDHTHAAALMENFLAEYVSADKGYDAEGFVLKVKGQDTEAVIPSRCGNQVQRERLSGICARNDA